MSLFGWAKAHLRGDDSVLLAIRGLFGRDIAAAVMTPFGERPMGKVEVIPEGAAWCAHEPLPQKLVDELDAALASV